MKRITLLLFVLTFFSCKKDENKILPNKLQTTVTDIDSNIYQTICIGSQIWMKENLKVVHYRDGSLIQYVIGESSWGNLTSGAYCSYNKDLSYLTDYGGIYNWYAINSGKLCPIGWHVPNNTDWNTLINFLGGDTIAGGKLKEIGFTHWNSPNTGATNEVGFSAIAGGYRYQFGTFDGLGKISIWWSSTETNITSASTMSIVNDKNNSFLSSGYNKKSGYYVRCIKD